VRLAIEKWDYSKSSVATLWPVSVGDRSREMITSSKFHDAMSLGGETITTRSTSVFTTEQLMGGAPFRKVYCLTFQSRDNPKTPFISSTDQCFIPIMSHGQSRPNECKRHPPLQHVSKLRTNQTTNTSSWELSLRFRTTDETLNISCRKDEFPRDGYAGNRARLYTEFNGSSPYNFGLNHDHPNLGQDDYEHSVSKRLKDFSQFHSSPEKRDPDDQAASVQYSVPCISVDSEEQHNKPAVLQSESIDDRQEAPSSPPRNKPIASTNISDQQVHLLALPEDKSHLTALHCFVRRQCVYFFTATAEDVKVPRKGRQKSLVLGQIGIGCIHCKDSKSKLKGCTYFPGSIGGIYNATMIIMQRHFPVCPSVTKEIFGDYNKLKSLTARSASTKEYWVSAAIKLGLFDTKHGVFFKKEVVSQNEFMTPMKKARNNLKDSYQHSVDTLCSLVETSDKMFATDYAYFVMEQMTRCTFTEADRLGKRKRHQLGFPGLACKHCFGGNGSGRFFPLTLKTFSDVSKSLHVLRNHLVKCARAPNGMAKTVNKLYGRHERDKQSTPFGSQKIFFDLVWKRLHPELDDAPIMPGLNADPVQPTLFKSIKNESLLSKKPSSDSTDEVSSRATADNHFEDVEDTQSRNYLQNEEPSPELIFGHQLFQANQHWKVYSTAGDPLLELPSVQTTQRSSKELCRIPKKRYLKSIQNSQHSINTSESSLPIENNSHKSLHSSPRRSYGSTIPSPAQGKLKSSNYSDSDLSAALILAEGMGRDVFKSI